MTTTGQKAEPSFTMAYNNPNFEAGMPCRLSELGKSRSPKLAAKVGKILRRTRARNQVVVLWDGNTTPITLHRTYVEPLPRADEHSRRGYQQAQISQDCPS